MTSSAQGGGERDGLPLDDFLPYLLNRIVARMNRDLVAALRPLGLTQRDWRILAVLSTGEGRTLRELEVYTITPQSTLSRLIDRMAALGLVEKRGAESDGRTVEVHVTGAGREAYRRMLPVALAECERATRGLSPEEQRTLVRLLQRLLADIRRSPYP